MCEFARGPQSAERFAGNSYLTTYQCLVNLLNTLELSAGFGLEVHVCHEDILTAPNVSKFRNQHSASVVSEGQVKLFP
mgnify:CR=1 FL=1